MTDLPSQGTAVLWNGMRHEINTNQHVSLSNVSLQVSAEEK